jgi:hypothetical protein
MRNIKKILNVEFKIEECVDEIYDDSSSSADDNEHTNNYKGKNINDDKEEEESESEILESKDE